MPVGRVIGDLPQGDLSMTEETTSEPYDAGGTGEQRSKRARTEKGGPIVDRRAPWVPIGRCICCRGEDAPHGSQCNRRCKPDSIYCRSCTARRCACSCSGCDPADLSSGSGEEQTQVDEGAQPGDAVNHDTKYDDRKGKCNATNLSVSGGADLSFLTSLNYAIPAPKRTKKAPPPPYSPLATPPGPPPPSPPPLAPPAGTKGKAAGKYGDSDAAAKAMYTRRAKLLASIYDGIDDDERVGNRQHKGYTKGKAAGRYGDSDNDERVGGKGYTKGKAAGKYGDSDAKSCASTRFQSVDL